MPPISPLYQAFLSLNKDWESKELYAKYEEERKKYLGKKADDKVEQGKIIVELTRRLLGMGCSSVEERRSLKSDEGSSNLSTPAKYGLTPATAREIREAVGITAEDVETVRRIVEDHKPEREKEDERHTSPEEDR